MPAPARFARLVLALVATLAVLLGLTVQADATSVSVDRVAAAQTVAHRGLLARDAADSTSSGAVANRWRTRTITYYSALSPRWSWSLSRAVAAWNTAGGRVHFSRTSIRSHARLVISTGYTGGASGLATVGATTHPFVHIDRSWSAVDPTEAWNRVAVMEVLAHELGHVLGFEHTTTRCALMNATIDMLGCGILPSDTQGSYRCRIIDSGLGHVLVRAYGGSVRVPTGHWCLIDPLPSAVSNVAITQDAGAPASVTWTRPRSAPSGSSIRVKVWTADTCTTAPAFATEVTLPVSQTTWQDDVTGSDEGSGTCVNVRSVNRYALGRTAVTRWMPRATPAATPADSPADTTDQGTVDPGTTPAADPSTAPTDTSSPAAP